MVGPASDAAENAPRLRGRAGLSGQRRALLVALALAAVLGAAGIALRGGLLAPAPLSSGPHVENFALLDHEGRHRELYYHSDARAIVLFVHGNGCPIARKSLPALRALRDRFAAQGVIFWLLDANAQDERASVAAEARAFDIDFPILLDDAQLVADSLELTRTAEALVIDPRRWQLVYRGPLDDRLSYGSRSAACSTTATSRCACRSSTTCGCAPRICARRIRRCCTTGTRS